METKPSFFEKSLLFIDIETTGPRGAGGEICEIGAIGVDQKTFAAIEERNWKVKVINPCQFTEVQMNWNKYNGYTAEDWVDARPLSEVLKELEDFGGGRVPCGWNVSFDRSWLEDAFTAQGSPFHDVFPFDYRWICVMSLWYERCQQTEQWPARFSQSGVATHLGLDAEPMPHRAINGARQTLELYRFYRTHATS